MTMTQAASQEARLLSSSRPRRNKSKKNNLKRRTMEVKTKIMALIRT
jgi:hypothetical protein